MPMLCAGHECGLQWVLLLTAWKLCYGTSPFNSYNSMIMVRC